MKKILLIVFTLNILVIFSQERKVTYKINNVGINTKSPNYGTAFFGNNKIVYSTKKGKMQHLYVGDIINGDVKNERPLKQDKENTHESNVAFTNDYKTLYFTKSLYSYEKGNKIIKQRGIAIFKASIASDGSWGNIEKLPFNSDKYYVGHPTLNKENNKLYFSSNMPGSIGESDIYVVDVYSNGTYSEPRNLGPKVNTKGNELHPFISGDNILYFSSNGQHDGLGGLDIYYVELDRDVLDKPVHLKYPINSKSDDFSYIIDHKRKQGFFSSNRGGGKGEDDIYFFSEKEEIVEEEVKEETCRQTIIGTVFINATRRVIPNSLIVLKNKQGKDLKKFQSKANGKFAFSVDCSQDYELEATRSEYKKSKEKISITSQNEIIVRKEIYLTRLKKTKAPLRTLSAGQIDFNYNESKLLKRFTYELDIAIRLMKENPKLRIEIESHTDSRAPDEFNMELTEQRIEAIREYMAYKGIMVLRIKGEAFGETKPLNHCVNDVICTEEDYLINRRTTFILKEK
jgi:outer membrane protein OmpA-like peptidoglycan-associated protein